MYPHSNSTISRAAYTTDYSASQPPPYPYLVTSMHSISISTSHQQHNNFIPDQLAVTEFDSLVNSDISFNNNNNNNNSCSSGCSSYSSPTSSLANYNYGNSQRPSLMHRSVSSHSLLIRNNNENRHPISSFFADFFDSSDDGPVRRVLSTGDLQRNHGSEIALSSESSMILEGMSRAYPYSPEEKKVRIERYRSKRNLRNFNKKIKYACRKTLADSRPRIRGRFARNEENDKNRPVQWSHENGIGVEEDEEDENWVNLFGNLVDANNLDQEPQDNTSFNWSHVLE